MVLKFREQAKKRGGRKTIQSGSGFLFFLAIFVFFFLIASPIFASEVTGDLSTGLIGTKTITTITSTIMEEEVANGLISTGSTNPESTPNFTFNVDYILNAGEATVSIPADTVVTKTGGGNLDLTTFFTSDNTVEIKNESGDVLGSVKIGIPDISLTFSQSITITIPVGTAYNGQTLTAYYRSEGSTVWNIETTCLITDGNCTFQTSHATTFATRKNPTSSSSSSSASSNSNNSVPSCGDAKSSSTPDLFQINASSTTAKLFFTPISNTTSFYISFSTKPNAEEHGAEATLAREGVQNFTISLLKPSTTYYFKVRGQIGCMPGDWSNIIKITTPSKGTTKTSFFYKKTNIIKKIISRTNSVFTPQKVIKTETTIIPEPIPTVIVQPSTDDTVNDKFIKSTPTPKKKCFLWWCF